MANKNKVVIIDKSIQDFVESAQIEFGGYVNNHRHMPRKFDGMKPSYEKVVFTGLTLPDRFLKVATIIGECGGKYSPHAPDSLAGVCSELVHAGIFDGQGGHGSKNIYKAWNVGAAAPRYVEAKLNKDWRRMIEFVLPLVPREMSDLGYSMPEYIPAPIPLSLLYGSLGLGIGIRSKIPNFSFKSLIEAYEANDPKLLQPNGDIIINRKKSELDKLWTTGMGKVSYMFRIEEDSTSIDGSTKGFTMYGDPRFFQVSLTDKLAGNPDKDIVGWIDKGLVIMRDESKRKEKKIFFSVAPRQRQVTLEMLRAELEIIRYNNESFKLAVSDGSTTRVTPLKEWIGDCYNNYNRLVEEMKLISLDKLALKEKVVNAAEDVATYILANPKHTKEEISKSLKLDLEVVGETVKKSIAVLMKLDKDKELESIKEKVVEVTNLKPRDYYENLLR